MPTKIEWIKNPNGTLGETWNPVTGCSPISEGCLNCYARKLAEGRLRGRCGYLANNPFQVTYHPDRLYEPQKCKNPKTFFVCSMGDLFHPEVKIGWLTHIFDMIHDRPEHTFIVLTKRPERVMPMLYGKHKNGWRYMKEGTIIPNLWLGVSVENQQRADERIPILLQIPATVRFISIEPMLGPIDLKISPAHINWVIMGCESGPKVRPMKYKWAQNVLKQCIQTGTPLFYKQGPDDYNRIVKMPQLGGKIWDQMPKGMSKC